MHLPPPEVHRTTCVWCARLASSQSVACSALWQLLCKALPAGAGMPSAALPPSPPAALQFFVKDMSGMVGGILFASTQGSGLDCYAKQWRLFADVMNDVGQWGCPGKVVLHAQWLIRKQVLHRLTGISTGPRTAAPHKLAAGSSCMVSFSLCARTYRSNGFCPAVPPDAFHLWATCAGMALELASPLLPGALLLLACSARTHLTWLLCLPLPLNHRPSTRASLPAVPWSLPADGLPGQHLPSSHRRGRRRNAHGAHTGKLAGLHFT